jgi:hypothetical protein
VLTRRNVLWVAWTIWVVLLLIPYGVVPFALHGTVTGVSKADEADRWFLAIMIYLAVALPLAFLLRSWAFKPYRRGEAVSPRAYVCGMTALWLVLAVAGLTAQFACLATATFAPNVLPAVLALIVYLVVYPRGTAIAGRRAAEADGGHDHEEPG